MEKIKKNKGISWQCNPSVIGKASIAGITLVALVVTIVVLLILAGITITYVFGDNSVFKQASDAKLKTDIAQWQERLETAKSPIFIEGLGTFDPDAYFQYIQEQGIINNKDIDVVDNGDGTYDVTTKPGYVFLVTLMPTPEKPTDAEIEYIGQEGKIPPIIRRIETSATATSITGKAVVSRLGNGTVTYYYKLSTAGDDSYVEITNVNTETGATQSTGITAGEEYIIKVVAKNEIGETEKIAKITATKIFIESIILNKENTTIVEEKTEKLTATVKPSNSTNKTLKWTSSNETIATVTDEGVVTGKAEGTATITVAATDGSNKTASCVVTVKVPTVADVIGETQENTITVKDENGNKVVIPGGFRVLPHGTKSDDINEVIYNYDAEHKPCVQDGIVIADEEDNQFVWIPVGDIKDKDNTTTTITLGRYTFDTTNGTPKLQQDALNHEQVVTIENMNQESSSNSGATNLKEFLETSLELNGYYLARYESSSGGSLGVMSKAGKSPANGDDATARVKCKSMYTDHSFVSSDLVNSYAWDTTLNFVQEYSDYPDYSIRKADKLGVCGANEDLVCNLSDLRSNYQEWTTEYCSYRSSGSFSPGFKVLRGGTYRTSEANGYRSPSNRSGQDWGYLYSGYKYWACGRVVLYLK